jgi:hypothetical protein
MPWKPEIVAQLGTEAGRESVGLAVDVQRAADAVIAARSRIVEGAVGMVEMALARLTDRGVVELDEERTAAMGSNLMVVLCGDQPPSPIVNASTLYS